MVAAKKLNRLQLCGLAVACMQHVETGTARAGFLGAVNVGSAAEDVLMLLTVVTFRRGNKEQRAI